jgi:hypothetical protein
VEIWQLIKHNPKKSMVTFKWDFSQPKTTSFIII